MRNSKRADNLDWQTIKGEEIGIREQKCRRSPWAKSDSVAKKTPRFLDPRCQSASDKDILIGPRCVSLQPINFRLSPELGDEFT